MTNKFKLYDGVRNHDFSENTCFLCGAKNGNLTKEHVMPKWLLEEFDLWDKHLTLLNGTVLPYRQLVIPCCKTCNGNYLSKIETEVKNNFFKGPEAVIQMDRMTLFVWVLKIFYGFLYREIFLKIDRNIAESPSIVSPEDMEQFQLLHYILQSVRVPIIFSSIESDIPGSLYVFSVKDVPLSGMEGDIKYDYIDDINNRTIYLRLGKVGIMAAFDMGAQTYEGANYFGQYQSKHLHPIQLAELGSDFFLKASVFHRVPKVIFSESPTGVKFMVMPISGMSNAPVFGTWDKNRKSEMLKLFTKYPMEILRPVEDKVITWLKTENGDFNEIL